jgi:hypothetical protein
MGEEKEEENTGKNEEQALELYPMSKRCLLLL